MSNVSSMSLGVEATALVRAAFIGADEAFDHA